FKEDYKSLLDVEKRSKNARLLVVPPSDADHPFVITTNDITEQIDDNPLLGSYAEKDLLTYFKMNKFINPTHNHNNSIGGMSALISHSPTHFKITKKFIVDGDINFPIEKIENFEKLVKKEKYYDEFSEVCERAVAFLKEFDNKNFELNENDYIVFLVANVDISGYIDLVGEYVSGKLLKYPTFEGECNCCGTRRDLYMITQGNTFDIGKGRKYLFRHPTRWHTSLLSDTSENYNICEECAKQIYNFFEYIKLNKFYRYPFPTKVDVDTNDYRGYSQKPLGILKMLRRIYEKNRSEEFDYIMMTTDPSMKNVEFRYIGNFNYVIPNENQKVDVRYIPISSTLKELKSKGKEDEITIITNRRDKGTFLSELNLIFNNTLVPSLFETDPKELIPSLHPFIKLKLIEYNSIFRNFIYFQDISLFEDCVYTKFFREMLFEMVGNSNLRDEMKLGPNKIRFFLTIYYKYVSLESNGGEIISKYIELNEKMKKNADVELDNEFEVSYFIGQLFYYLLRISTVKNRLDLFNKYILNVHSMDVLKKRLIDVLEKYS
ncbi:unnamed protein product, partial [marine sediment metagenome]